MMRRSRLEFTKPTKRAALARSQGICECARVPSLMRILRGNPCTVRLSTGNTEYHHIVADYFRPDNSLDNLACLTRTCHALVTDLVDKKEIARTRRREDRHNGIRRMPRQVLMGTVASGVSRGFDQIPRWRDSGRQWPRPATPDGPNAVIGSPVSVFARVPLLEADPVLTSEKSS